VDVARDLFPRRVQRLHAPQSTHPGVMLPQPSCRRASAFKMFVPGGWRRLIPEREPHFHSGSIQTLHISQRMVCAIDHSSPLARFRLGSRSPPSLRPPLRLHDTAPRGVNPKPSVEPQEPVAHPDRTVSIPYLPMSSGPAWCSRRKVALFSSGSLSQNSHDHHGGGSRSFLCVRSFRPGRQRAGNAERWVGSGTARRCSSRNAPPLAPLG
jgi:hypothetical protein